MAANYGVVANYRSSSIRPIQAKSITPIGIVLTADKEAGLYYFSSPAKALEEFTNTTGNAKTHLQDGAALGLECPTIVSVAPLDADKAVQKSNIINAIFALKKAEALTNYRPDVLIAPDFSRDVSVANALANTAEALKARAFVDADAKTETEAITFKKQFSSMRVTVTYPDIKFWNTDTNQEETKASSSLFAWLRILIDGKRELGWADSISNRSVSIDGTDPIVEFTPGETCEADRLRTEGVAHLISYKGWRTWGEQNCSEDPIWKDARRVRIFDRLVEAAIDKLFWAVDKDINALTVVKDSVKDFMNSLSPIMLGFRVTLDTERTTVGAINAGKFYFLVETEEVPVARRIEITFDRTDKYAPVVYNILTADEEI